MERQSRNILLPATDDPDDFDNNWKLNQQPLDDDDLVKALSL